MEMFKVEEYVVHEGGREYHVLKFPFVKHMWAYDHDYPAEDRQMVDGSLEVFSLLKYAMAILIMASDKIIYFPCHQEGIGRYYDENYDLVLCTPKVQLRRSSWIKIRRKMNNKTRKGNCIIRYDRKKLDDFCEKKLLDTYDRGLKRCITIKPEFVKKIRAEHLEKVEDNTMFWVLGKTECYCAHYHTVRDVDEMENEETIQLWSWFGWFLSDMLIYKMYEEAETGQYKEKNDV